MLTYGESGYEEGCLKLSLLWRRLIVHMGAREPLSFRELQSENSGYSQFQGTECDLQHPLRSEDS